MNDVTVKQYLTLAVQLIISYVITETNRVIKFKISAVDS